MTLPDLIAVEDLFRLSERSGASISPDGTRLAFLAPWRNRLNVWISDLVALNTRDADRFATRPVTAVDAQQRPK